MLHCNFIIQKKSDQNLYKLKHDKGYIGSNLHLKSIQIYLKFLILFITRSNSSKF